MPKKIFKLLLLSSFVVLVLTTLALIYYTQVYVPAHSTFVPEVDSDVERNAGAFDGTSRDYIDIKFKNDPVGKLKFQLGYGVLPFDLDASWDWKTTPFLSEIREIDTENNEITVFVTAPQGVPFQDSEKTFPLNCKPESTYHSDGMVTTSPVSSPVSMMNINDALIAFCGNDECTVLDGYCKIVKNTDTDSN